MYNICFQSINDQVLCIFLYDKNILLLLSQRKVFWDPLILDPKDNSASQKKIKESIKAINIFGVIMVSLAISYTSYSICLSMPPIAYWLPQNYIFMETIILVTEEIWFAYSCISVFAFNAIFIGFCANVCVQNRLISYTLENVAIHSNNPEAVKREMKLLIEHHIFVLECVT